jgi:hypothetical protein
MSDVNTDDEIQAEVQAVIEAAKASIASRYAPYGLEPEVYHIQACGQHIVCLPMTLQQRDTWLRQAKSQELKAHDLMLQEVVFWCRGQQEDGPAGAMKHLRGLAGLGGSFVLLIQKLSDEYWRLIDETGGAAQGKKK